ncbi:MAG: hypothetical protein PHD03_04060 [Bacilli bacterium]|nr:hypothetical protein [Bacilli bacterium]MDD4407199.1 hypothetical protein [Bacilli bacterium]
MKKSKNKTGYITIIISGLCLISTFILYRYLKIDDVFCVILMIFSLIIAVYGVFQIIRDTYNS